MQHELFYQNVKYASQINNRKLDHNNQVGVISFVFLIKK